MKELMGKMLEKKNWVVVGASENKSKFGYKIFKALKENGYNVYPVNPGYDKIDGEKCYHSVKEIPGIIDCVNVVVPPKVSLNLIDEVSELNIKNIWFQPGSFNDEIIGKAEEMKLKPVYNNCVLIELKSKFGR